MHSIATRKVRATAASVPRGRTAAQSVGCLPRSFLTEQLVESFVADTHYVSRNAQRLRDASDLPPPLERIATTVQRSPCVWLAWLDEQTTRFVVAAVTGGCVEPGLAIRLTFFDQDGRCVATGQWSLQRDGRWTLRDR
jgi:hypothetical protein